MDRTETLRVLHALCDGVDPASGAPLPSGTVMEKPPVMRALFDALRLLERKVSPTGRPRPENHGKAWTDEEDHRLVEAFNAGRTGAELAADHARSRTSIRSRLVKLGLLTE